MSQEEEEHGLFSSGETDEEPAIPPAPIMSLSSPEGSSPSERLASAKESSAPMESPQLGKHCQQLYGPEDNVGGGGLFSSSDSEGDHTPKKNWLHAAAHSVSGPLCSSSPKRLASAKESSAPMESVQLGINCQQFHGLEDNVGDGGLFSSSDSEGDPTPKNNWPHATARSVGVPLWSFEDLCNKIPHENRLGIVLRSAELVENVTSLVDRASATPVSAWTLYLTLHSDHLAAANMSLEEVCAVISSAASGSGLCVTPAADLAMKLTVSPGYSAICTSHAFLLRILSHIIDLPVNANQAPSHKKMKTSEVCEGSTNGLSAWQNFEQFLDGLCFEWAALPGRDQAEYEPFRERTANALHAQRAHAISEASRLRELARVAEVLTSRDRWLLQEGSPRKLEGQCLLTWAKAVSDEWWHMPATRRLGFQASAEKDRMMPEALVQARNIEDFAEEMDVFLKKLDPCYRCNKWDPCVETCKHKFCKNRICIRCSTNKCCSEECVELANDF